MKQSFRVNKMRRNRAGTFVGGLLNVFPSQSTGTNKLMVRSSIDKKIITIVINMNKSKYDIY